MADTVTAGGNVISTEQFTTLNGATVAAQHGQRVIGALQTADGVVVDGVGLAQKLDAVNDSVTTYPYGHNCSYISTATTTTVKTGAGVIHGILISETAAGAITIFDNTAGSGTTIALFKASIAEGTYMLNAGFTTGCTVVTAAASKVTVLYR